MFEEQHYVYMNQLSHHDSEIRIGALNELIKLEKDKNMPPKVFTNLTKDENPIIQLYGIGAILRLKIQTAYACINKFLETSTQPLMLVDIIEQIRLSSIPDFVPSLVDRISGKKSPKNADPIFDEAFILDQILIPILKYFQLVAHKKTKKILLKLLDHENKNIRWNTLKAIDKNKIVLEKKTLGLIQAKDSYALNRELASILLIKMDSTN